MVPNDMAQWHDVHGEQYCAQHRTLRYTILQHHRLGCPASSQHWLRSVKYDSSHRSTTPDMPKLSLSLFSSILWSSVSNAADRPRSDRMETDPWSQAMSRSFVTLNNKVSVLWSALYADWNGSSVSVAFRWSDSCWRTTFSRIFERKCRLETGR